MFDITEKSFEYASSSSRLLTTLATGIIAFTVTFSKEFGEKPTSSAQGKLLLVSWVLLLASAFLGCCTLLAMTGEIDPPKRTAEHKPSIRNPKVKFPLQLQIVTFMFGVLLIVIYGGLKLNTTSIPPPDASPTPTPTAEPGAVPRSTPSPTPVPVGTPKPTEATPVPTPTLRPRPKRRPTVNPNPRPSPCLK